MAALTRSGGRGAWRWLWAGAALLIFGQLLWWMFLFLGEDTRVAELRTQLLASQPATDYLADPKEVQKIRNDSRRRRTMIVSEVLFFATAVGALFFLIFKAFRREERDRRMQRDFLGILAHESKTPLTALKLRLESALEEPTAPAKDAEMKSALDDARRLAVLFDKAIQIYRLEQNPLFRETFSLAEPVAEVLRRLDPIARSRYANVEVTLDENVRVCGDRSAIAHAALCLIENAILYGDRTPNRIVVRVFGEHGTAVLSVADEGPGIDRETRSRLFQRFSRGKPGGPVPGTGLGLYLARRVAEMHRGSLQLRGAEGRGTCFELEFPAAEA